MSNGSFKIVPTGLENCWLKSVSDALFQMKYRIFTISQCSIKFNLFLVLCCVDLTLTA